jgi:hypothetical protein
MSEETQTEEVMEEKAKSHRTGESVSKAINSAGESVGKAINSIMDTLETALTGRGNTVMVRVNDEALAKLDMLVASGICGSRSESAAFLLQQGIEHSETLFTRISDVTGQITSMREELQEWVKTGAK